MPKPNVSIARRAAVTSGDQRGWVVLGEIDHQRALRGGDMDAPPCGRSGAARVSGARRLDVVEGGADG
jgi:hypothetical protein